MMILVHTRLTVNLIWKHALLLLVNDVIAFIITNILAIRSDVVVIVMILVIFLFWDFYYWDYLLDFLEIFITIIATIVTPTINNIKLICSWSSFPGHVSSSAVIPLVVLTIPELQQLSSIVVDCDDDIVQQRKHLQ
jgi:hypothetical protein